MKATSVAFLILCSVLVGCGEKQQTFTNKVGQTMIWLPEGSFRMGDLTGNGEENERPPREVELSGFYLGATEVTQGQWKAVMGTGIREQEKKKEMGWISGEGADHPMYFVSWEDAMEFCRKLTEYEQEAGELPEEHVYTLPTEAQWEYACRAGTESEHAGTLAEMAWYGQGMEKGTAHAVGQKQPNAWGFYDMYGNVREWCQDWYADSYQDMETVDPIGPDEADAFRKSRTGNGPFRVTRGGSWLIKAEKNLRSARRHYDLPSIRFGFYGLRVSLVRSSAE